MDDLELPDIPNHLSGSWQQLRVEGVELIRICVTPDGQTVNSPDDLEGLDESVDNIASVESICLAADFRDDWGRLVTHVLQDIFHLGAHGR